MIIKIKQVGNHFYPCINHDFGYNISLCRNTERWFRIWNKHKVIRPDEVEIEFEEIGIEISGINIIYFYEEDITRYLTTDDYFDMTVWINNHYFVISSDLYSILEQVYQFKFHENIYRVELI